MKSKGHALIPVIIITAAFLVGLGSYLFTKKNDGHVEQAAEAVLRTHGIDIDFSPDDEAD